jgi:hypothetical protein
VGSHQEMERAFLWLETGAEAETGSSLSAESSP